MMRIRYFITLALLGACALVVCYTFTHMHYGTANIMLFAPLVFATFLASIFRRSAVKSIVMLTTSAVLLYETVESCYPVIKYPDDIFFPLMDLMIIELWIVSYSFPFWSRLTALKFCCFTKMFHVCGGGPLVDQRHEFS